MAQTGYDPAREMRWADFLMGDSPKRSSAPAASKRAKPAK